jgi:hypothetical protein
MYTMDFKPDRINVKIDKAHVITAVTKG